MSSKGAGGVAERRLRPLWDAIDSRQYKTALKLASTLLSKHPDSAYLLVLKALVLERTGKGEEALVLCQQAKESGPVDDLTLSTLQIVFQRLDRLEQATLCYEHACGKNPNNIELMLGLFNCYIREYSYLKQQQTAMKMYKVFGEERYLLWAICSIQLQVWCGNGDKALLQLAEALLKKRMDSHEFQELEALLVYVNLLQQQGKFQAALDVLSSKMGGLFSIVNDKLKLQGKLLLSSRQYKRAAEVFQEVLKTSSDDWAVFLQFLDASLEGSCWDAVATVNGEENMKLSGESVEQVSGASISCLPREEAEKRLQMANIFLQELQKIEGQELRRGPFLGSVEIERRRLLLKLTGEKVHEQDSAFSSDLRVSIVDYFKRFGHMVSFGSDVQDYLEVLRRHEGTNLVELLWEVCNKAEDESAVKILRQKITIHQVEVQLGLKAAAPDKDILIHAIGIAKLYVGSLQLSKDLDPQENMHGEELLTMATSLLIELFWRTKHPGYIVEAILILEFGLSVRRYSFQYKIMLINLYCTLSCVSAAFDWYKTLDVKNILIETLSHHMLPSLLKCTLWSELDSLLKEIIQFYEDYLREAADLTILAYRHCNYSKVLEFVQFKERLQHSHNLLLVKAENSILRLKQRADNPEEVQMVLANMKYGHEALEWSKDEKLMALSFNEDLETRPWWSPAPDECFLTGTGERPLNWRRREPEKQRLQREEKWRLTVRRRCLLPRLIHLSVGAVSLLKEADSKENIARPDITELKQLIESFGETLGWSWEKLDDLFSDLSSSKISLKDVNVEASDLFSLALFWTAYKIALQPFCLANTKAGLVRDLGLLTKLVKNFLAELTKATVVSDGLGVKSPLVIASWSALPSLVCLTTEAFAWFGLCLQAWFKCVQPVGKVGKKKKKVTALAEQSDNSANGNLSSLLDALNHCTHSFCTELEGFISWLTELLAAPESGEIDGYLASLKSGRQSETAVGDDIIPVPGLVIHVLESSSKSANELGQRIGIVSQTWQPDPFIKKLVSGKRAILHDLRESSALRLKALKSLKL